MVHRPKTSRGSTYQFTMHDDDQIMPIEFSIKRSAKLIKNAKPEIEKRTLARHLLAFLNA
jgi:hypothetical protein